MRRLWGAAREPSGAGWEQERAEAPQEAPGAWSGRPGPGRRGGEGWAAPALGGAGLGPRPLDSRAAPPAPGPRCGSSTPADAWRAGQLGPLAPWAPSGSPVGAGGRRGDGGCRGSLGRWRPPGVTCTALVAYACWGSAAAAALGAAADPPRPVGVLLWWEPFGRRGGAARPPPDCRLRFNISGCRLLTDRATYGDARAVLFHHRDLVKGPPDWPPPWGVRARTAELLGYEEAAAAAAAEAPATSGPRPPGQRWVWMNFESPSHSPGLRSLASNLFNWTLSYRADSDVFVPYGHLYPRSHPGQQPSGLAPPLSRKRGLVAWVVSHWDERQARVRYYRQLSQHVAVDVFGRGGPGQPVPPSGLLHTVARYKFYLAFENSQHLDYITEKLWRNALLAGAVPVVLGPDRANYERFMPRGAFIHVDDFPSASSLATYLLFLDRSPAVYLRYFHWRRSYAVHITSFWDEPWCRVCQAVQRAGDRPKSIRNLAGWFER
uniref:Fucosyltransferase n=1 Tax=Aotus nancymaae TaxID=37293 RepID=A0A2K5BY07_AOTNA